MNPQGNAAAMAVDTAEQARELDRERLYGMISTVLRALGEPLRLRLLGLLRDHELCVNELARASGASQANVSKHLAVLRQAGLVDCRRDGHSMYYRVADPGLFEICGATGRLLERRLGVGERLARGGRQLWAGGGKGEGVAS